MPVSDIELRLIDGWQRGFPLARRPYLEVATDLGISETELLAMLSRLLFRGALSRVGAVVRPNTVGASTLAAMRVPSERLEEVAHIVNAELGVNHNYEREHAFNLWFVVTGPDRRTVQATLARLARSTGCPPLDLPLERPYFIDLGFNISGNGGRPRPGPIAVRETNAGDRRFLAVFENGLSLETRPYRTLASRLGMEEDEVIGRLSGLIDDGIVSRFGLVVRHRELGYRANAMVVWDLPDGDVDEVGERFAAQPFVRLCYRRPRRRPRWPYNLFCMIHGRERNAVLDQIDTLNVLAATAHRPQSILFSRRRFKQRGARLSAA